MAWKVSRQSEKCLNDLRSFRIIWKVSGQPGEFLDCLERFLIIWIFSRLQFLYSSFAKTIYALYLSPRKTIYTLFFAKTIYALGLESFCALNFAIWKVQTFWASENASLVTKNWHRLVCTCTLLRTQKNKIFLQFCSIKNIFNYLIEIKYDMQIIIQNMYINL